MNKPPANMTDGQKANHPHWRRQTRKYQRKRRVVRDVWIVSGLIMIAAPIGALPILVLGTTFLSFLLLDETP